MRVRVLRVYGVLQRIFLDPSTGLKYGLAGFAALVALGIRFVLDPVLGAYSPPYLGSLVAVIVAAWFGGRGPGFASMAVGALGISFFFLKPRYSFLIANHQDMVELARYVAVASLTSLLVGGLRRSFLSTARAEQALRRKAQLVDLAHDAIVTTDSDRRITGWNSGAAEMYGWKECEALGRSIHDLQPSGEGSPSFPADELLNREGRWDGELNHIARDGRRLIVESRQVLLRNDSNEPEGILLINRDITERRRAEQDADLSRAQMDYSARHDIVTGLPNRLSLYDRASQAIDLARRNHKSAAVIFLDLDHFKYINDSLGHAVGDRLLQSVAKRLVACVRASDAVSRLGGDEFVVLLSEVARPDDAAMSARKILGSFGAPHCVADQELHISGSMGISIYPQDGEDAETLIQNADTAMYQAKKDGRSRFKFFKAEMNAKAIQRQLIEDCLRRALERDEFLLHYQPKMSLATGTIAGVEALVRWQRPGCGLVPPAEFLPVAEDCGLIVQIDRWVLREACKQERDWQDAGLPQMAVSVNISAIEFRNKGLIKTVRETLSETGLEAQFLELELAEGFLMKDAESTDSMLRELKLMGVRLAVDDFGMGYSSLSYLRRFPIDVLKIDQSFVRQLTASPGESAIVEAIISMGLSLGLLVVAEGIETQEQRELLEILHCGEGQGYLFSRPMAAPEFADFLAASITRA